ncbi:MAG: HAMP domain-containing sensor histidine kinase, partial [Bacteroidota bacterium]
IQFNFVRIGFGQGKRKFDQSLNRTYLNFRSEMEQSSELGSKMTRLFQDVELFYLTPKDSSLLTIQDDIQSYLQQQLRASGVDVEVSFAITGDQHKPLYIVSKDFDASRFRFDTYTTTLGNRLEQSCNCTLFLHLYSTELNSFVLQELGYLIWPSVLIILVILVCLGLLLYLLQKQQKLNEVKNDFINNLTHELKTPVFSISLATRLLNEKMNAPANGSASSNHDEMQRLVGVVKQENEKLKIHIDRVLELASLENEKQHLQKIKVDVNSLLEDLAKANQLKVEQHGARLVLERNEAPGSKVAAAVELLLDPDHFKNAVQNLIDNAVKYGHRQGLQIRLRVEPGEASCRIVVEDNGAGIAAAHQQKIFEKFYRIPTGNLHEVKGFGLGLSYVRQIVQAHGGTVRVESKPGQGSRFTLEFPNC